MINITSDTMTETVNCKKCFRDTYIFINRRSKCSHCENDQSVTNSFTPENVELKEFIKLTKSRMHGNQLIVRISRLSPEVIEKYGNNFKSIDEKITLFGFQCIFQLDNVKFYSTDRYRRNGFYPFIEKYCRQLNFLANLQMNIFSNRYHSNPFDCDVTVFFDDKRNQINEDTFLKSMIGIGAFLVELNFRESIKIKFLQARHV